MRFLITGGAGFVGSSLALALKQKWPESYVVCLDNLYRRGSELNLPRLRAAGVDFVYGDVREPQSLQACAGAHSTSSAGSRPFDLLIECSAEPSVLAGRQDSSEYLIATNLMGAYHCLEAARRWQSRFLFLSTSRVYPIIRLEAHPWREDPTRFSWEDLGTDGITSRGVAEGLEMGGARSLYGFTKYAGEQLIEEYRAAFGLQAVINRCGVIAGPWQFGRVDQGVVALWVLAHHFGRPLAYIGYGGQGKQVRDFLHIDDLCELLLEQIEHFEAWEGWVGNVSGGLSNSASLCELTGLCREIVGRELPLASIPAHRPYDLRLFIGDCAQLFARTSWRPTRTVRQIVTDLALWVKCHEAELLQVP